MADITASLKDHSMLYLQCDRGIGAELSEYFSFYVPGYKFMPAYKHRVWDGKIRLFNSMTNELNAGLFVYLYKFCEERKYKLTSAETVYGLPFEKNDIDIGDLNNMIADINVPFPLRDYQCE